ncbi:MAG: undecaprenyl-diphosphate phosphatase [Candidatus Micrarchaeota archaeon]
MDILEALALGMIQGITEWLPISSSGHLALAQHLFGTEVPVSFDIILHLGTLLAVIAYYREYLISLVKGVLARDAKSLRLASLLIITAIPTAIIGLIFKDFFESMFSDMLSVAIALAVTGVFLIFAGARTRKPDSGTPNPKPGTATPGPGTRDALLIGLAQGFAVAPGISRSGATIGTALLLGIERNEAARFSFLAGIAPILGAAILEGRHALSLDIGLFPLAAGFITAAIVGYLSIGLLLRFLKESRFHLFGYYCLLLSAAIIIVLIAL